MKDKNNTVKVGLAILLFFFIVFTIILTSRISSPEQVKNIFNINNDSKSKKKVKISVDAIKEIMTGLYPQYSKLGIPLLSIDIENPTSKAILVNLESEIIDISHKTKSIEILKSGENKKLIHCPQIKDNTKLLDGNSIFTLHYILKIDEKTISEESVSIKFVAKDVLFWGYMDNNNNFIDTSELISAWVTPTTKEIRELLKKSAKYHPDNSLYGYQLESNDDAKLIEYSRKQIKAIYNCLKKEYNIRYVNTPVSFTPKNIIAQRINFPSETLTRSIANCIDSTVLFASAVEAIGMNPYIIILPGHSLFGWSIGKDSNKIDAIDVTYVSDLSFDNALKIAQDKLKSEGIDFSEKNPNKYSLISIKEVRQRRGVDPIE